jgi:hypothetical protein
MGIAERFWPKVDRSGDCWLWTAGKAGKGYGVLMVGSRRDGNKRMAYAHRVSYEMARGPIPPGMLVRHSCDTPACVNPAHLSLGKHLDNSRDAVERGRTTAGDRHPWRANPALIRKGERHHGAKLTDQQVREIRERYAAGDISQRQLGAEYGIQQGAVSAIIRRAKWSHLP